jgi:hypothetical protein
MADPRDPKSKPPPRWPLEAPASQARQGRPFDPGKDRISGRIKHDDRGNAVWDWLKETGRFCIDSTSALLKRLEVPELKVEGRKDEGLRLEVEGSRDEGGGYDPYNQKTPARKVSKLPPRK